MAPTVSEVTDPHLSVYTRVPNSSAHAVCEICHVPRDESWDRCWSCHTTTGQVSNPLSLVVPISLYNPYSQMGKWLRRYKDPGDITTAQQRRFTRIVAATFGRFLRHHQGCIEAEAGQSWDLITTVPSTLRQPPHPLDGALQMLPWLRDDVETALERTTASVDHNEASDYAFSPVLHVNDRSVLLIDDTWTTGARVQSAASALTLAGAEVVAAIVVGRVVRPGSRYSTDEWWRQQRATPFTFDTCCLE